MGYRALPVSDLPTIDYPTISGQRESAGRQPGHDGRGGGDAAREAVLDDPGRQPDHLDAAARAARTSRCSSISIATSTRPRRTCRRRSRARTRQLPPGMPAPPSYNKVNPADSADLLPRAELAHAAALAGRRVRRDQPRAAHFDGRRRRAGLRLRRAEVRGAGRPRSAASWRRAASASTRSRTAIQNGTASRPTGTLYGANQNFTVFAQNGQLLQRRRSSGRSSSPTGTAARSASTKIAHVYDGVENDKTAQLGRTTTRGHLPVDSAAAGHEHGRGRRRDPRAAADAAGSSCRRR